MITADDVLFVADDCCNAMHIGQQLHMYIPLENLCSDIESDYFVERTAGSGLLIFVYSIRNIFKIQKRFHEGTTSWN